MSETDQKLYIPINRINIKERKIMSKVKVFRNPMKSNNQVTIPKEIREEHNLEQGDMMYLEIRKIIDPRGNFKYPHK